MIEIPFLACLGQIDLAHVFFFFCATFPKAPATKAVITFPPFPSVSPLDTSPGSLSLLLSNLTSISRLGQMVSPLWKACSEGHLENVLDLLKEASSVDIEIKGEFAYFS
jgi:hypothetical protein